MIEYICLFAGMRINSRETKKTQQFLLYKKDSRRINYIVQLQGNKVRDCRVLGKENKAIQLRYEEHSLHIAKEISRFE